jgi:chemotaxis protein CheC
MSKEKLTVLEKDILTEVGSICAGNATTALVQMVGKKIYLNLPSLDIVNIKELPRYLASYADEVVIGIHMQILGGARGNALLVLPTRDAFKIVDLLLGPSDALPSSLTEIGMSSLKEMGNILISAYLSVLTTFTGIPAFPSTVTLTNGAASSLVNLAFAGLHDKAERDTILIKAVFDDKRRNLSGHFFIIFDFMTIREILDKTKKMIKKVDGE